MADQLCELGLLVWPIFLFPGSIDVLSLFLFFFFPKGYFRAVRVRAQLSTNSSGGSPPCDNDVNLQCAIKVWQWGGNSFRLWSTCGGCGCC
jgi:hypothetical protein